MHRKSKTNCTSDQNRARNQRLSAEDCRQRQFVELARRFRMENDPVESKRLGEKLGRMVFGE
jgi:hypothetical protein